MINPAHQLEPASLGPTLSEYEECARRMARGERVTLVQLRAERAQAAAESDAGEDAKRATILEKAEQSEIVKRALALGCRVLNTSQARRSKVAPGLPDLFIFAPIGFLISFWWESKRQAGGRVSPAQEDFARDCARTNTRYGRGDRYAFAAYLIELGIAARATDGALVPVRRG